MPDQPDYYKTIHWGSQGQAVEAPRDWDVGQGESTYFFEEGDLPSGSSVITGPPLVPAGKLLLVDGWGGSLQQIGMFQIRVNVVPIQAIHRPANDGFFYQLPRPEPIEELDTLLVTATNQDAATGHYYLFVSGRLVDA